MPSTAPAKQPPRWFMGLLGLGFALAMLGTSAGIAWRSLAAVDFGYPLWFVVLDLRGHIDHFGPQNRHRTAFAALDDAAIHELFSQLVAALHQPPDRVAAALAAIRYQPPAAPAQPLLHAAEVAHLLEVAALIRGGLWLHLAALPLLLLTSVLRHRLSAPIPWNALVYGGGLGLGAASVVIAMAGPTRLFYWWHHLAFSVEIPWFFYYQDSLMTTMMKAPVLFGPIGLAWLGLTLLVAGVIGIGSRRPRVWTVAKAAAALVFKNRVKLA